MYVHMHIYIYVYSYIYIYIHINDRYLQLYTDITVNMYTKKIHIYIPTVNRRQLPCVGGAAAACIAGSSADGGPWLGDRVL